MNWQLISFFGDSTVLLPISSRFSVGLHKAAIITVYVLAAVVGYSRLVIHVHSVSEVVAGPLLATLCSCCCKNVPLIRKARQIRK
ncbi:hypothetical protein AWP51_24275 [Escherichia coli]|nr:hypothetical protein AWP51_24275 [Escherichia coli]